MNDSKLKRSFYKAKKIASFLAKGDTNIVSIYAMGSLAEGNLKKTSDADFTILIKDAHYDKLRGIKKSIISAEKKFKISIDTNFITLEEIKDNLINSQLFIHNYRHAHLIYELVFYKFHVYGRDILKKTATFDNCRMIPDSFKILQTLGYRLRKLYFTGKDKTELCKQAVKFFTYAVKFALFSKGFRTYYDDEAKKLFIKQFDCMDKNVVLEMFDKKRRGIDVRSEEYLLDKVFLFIDRQSLDVKNRMKTLLSTNCRVIIDVDKKNKSKIETTLREYVKSSSKQECDIFITDDESKLIKSRNRLNILFATKIKIEDEFYVPSTVDFIFRSLDDFKLIGAKNIWDVK